jgi:glycosyltransferase involved in cell wall biosynthesis
MSLGIIARCDNTGLGNQTRQLVEMLNPDVVILIDFRNFKDNGHYPEWYKGRKIINIDGHITNEQAQQITKDLDIAFSCETFYNDQFSDIAKQNGCKTILQYNHELFLNFNNKDFSLPDVLLSPSLWNMAEMQRFVRASKAIVRHLPPPTYPEKFAKNIKTNSKTHNRILHIHGNGAAFDRNGTDAIVDMLKRSTSDYELVIKTQVGFEPLHKDSRIIVEHKNEKNQEDLYAGFDALLMPRRYGGLCLPMNEALFSGLPVFMTNVEPNNTILPKEWLIEISNSVPVNTKNRVMSARPNVSNMASVIDNYMSSNKEEAKSSAYDIAYRNFSPQVLKDQYLQLFNSL